MSGKFRSHSIIPHNKSETTLHFAASYGRDLRKMGLGSMEWWCKAACCTEEYDFATAPQCGLLDNTKGNTKIAQSRRNPRKSTGIVEPPKARSPSGPNLARPPRLERGTRGLEGRCSVQLSYGRVKEQSLNKQKLACQRKESRSTCNYLPPGARSGALPTWIPTTSIPP